MKTLIKFGLTALVLFALSATASWVFVQFKTPKTEAGGGESGKEFLPVDHAVAKRAVDRMRDLVPDRHRPERTEVDGALVDDEEPRGRYGPAVDIGT